MGTRRHIALLLESERDYLCEGGILTCLLLEDLDPRHEIGLFYVLAYIYQVYSAAHPKGKSYMSDEDYTLFSKVEGELEQTVYSILSKLKLTYEVWLHEHFLGQPFYKRFRIVNDYQVGFIFVEEPDLVLGTVKPNDRNLWGTFRRKKDLDRFLDSGNQNDEGVQAVSYLRRNDKALYKNLQYPLHIYRVSLTGPPIMPDEWYFNFEERLWGKITRELYGALTIDSLSPLHPTVRQMHKTYWTREGFPLGFFYDILNTWIQFLRHTQGTWLERMATISVALNRMHSSGNMAKYYGATPGTDLFSHNSGVTANFLTKMSNLHQYVPQGTDHRTLRQIYNNWSSFL